MKPSDKDDWGELKRVLKYLKWGKHTKLTLRVGLLSIMVGGCAISHPCQLQRLYGSYDVLVPRGCAKLFAQAEAQR